jgi:hypothetical protein
MVREDSRIIGRLHKPPITFRGGAFYGPDILLVAVMFQIGPHPDLIYETWFNYYEPTGAGKKALEGLARQRTIAFHLYGDRGKWQASITINNSRKDFFRAAAERGAKIAPWSMTAFDGVRESLYTLYPSPLAFWKALGGIRSLRARGERAMVPFGSRSPV